MCDGIILNSVTHNYVVYQQLSTMCDECDECDGISKLYLQLLKNSFFFLKKNFNSKIPSHTSHISTTRMFAGFLPSQSRHTSRHTLLTHRVNPVTHSKNVVFSGPRTANHEPYITVRDYP